MDARASWRLLAGVAKGKRNHGQALTTQAPHDSDRSCVSVRLTTFSGFVIGLDPSRATATTMSSNVPVELGRPRNASNTRHERLPFSYFSPRFCFRALDRSVLASLYLPPHLPPA